MISTKNQSASEKGYDTDYAATSKTHTDRKPLQSPFKSKILLKTNGTINRDPLYKELNKRIINSSTSTVELSDGKISRKSDITIPKSNSTKIRPFKGNILFPFFPNDNVELGQKHESSRRQSKPGKPQPRTPKQVELGSSDNLTRTPVTRPSSKSTRRQTRQSKKSTTPPGYLASDESMFITSDTSDTSDWEWIAGDSPCRDVARERFISDSCKTQNQDGITLNPSLPNTNIKTEILEDNTIQVGNQPVECPISIISAGLHLRMNTIQIANYRIHRTT